LHKACIGEVLGGTRVGGEFGKHAWVIEHVSEAHCLCSIATLVRRCIIAKLVRINGQAEQAKA
jgi:hypothetical protein